MLTTLALALSLFSAPQEAWNLAAGSGSGEEPVTTLRRAEMPAAVAWRVSSQERPWLGVSLSGEGNLTVTEVQPDSPAERGGVQVGDRLLALDGEQLESFPALTEVLGASQVGDRVELEVGRRVELRFSDEHRAEDGRPLIGVFLSQNRITEVQEGRPAEAAGLRKGDRIVAIGDRETADADQVVEALRELEGDTAELTVGQTLELELTARPQGLMSPTPALPRVEGEAPRGFRRRSPTPLTPLPPPAPEHGGDAGALRGELRALSEEIRVLREEIARLREELKAMR